MQILVCRKMAGALKEGINIGDICTPFYSVAGTLANTYLKDSIKDYIPFEKIYPDSEYVDSIIRLAEESNYSIGGGRKSYHQKSICILYGFHRNGIYAFGRDQGI